MFSSPVYPAPRRASRSRGVNFLSLSPFPVYPGPRKDTLAAPPQLTENAAALNPASANLDAASSLTPLFATLTKNTRGWGSHPSSQIFSFHNPTTLYSLLSTISFRTLRLRAVLARRIRTYEKRGGGR